MERRKKRSSLWISRTSPEFRPDTCGCLLKHKWWSLHNWRKVSSVAM